MRTGYQLRMLSTNPCRRCNSKQLLRCLRIASSSLGRCCCRPSGSEGSWFWFCGFLLGQYRVCRLVRQAVSPPQWVRDGCMNVSGEIGYSRDVELLQSGDISSPFLCGLCQPRLFMPARMCDETYLDDLPGILVHELTHLCSHDLGWNLGLQLISILLWFHPLAWRMRKAIWQPANWFVTPLRPTTSAMRQITPAPWLGWPLTPVLHCPSLESPWPAPRQSAAVLPH